MPAIRTDLPDPISHDCAKKEASMLTILIAALTFAAVRGLVALAHSLRDVPRSNDDMVWF